MSQKDLLSRSFQALSRGGLLKRRYPSAGYNILIGGSEEGGGSGGGGGPSQVYEDYLIESFSSFLLAYYRLDESAGPTATDQTANSYDGTYTGAPASFNVAGIPNSNVGGCQFDSDSRVVLESSPGSNFRLSTFTISCWFKRLGAGVGTSAGTGTPTSVEPLVTKGRGESDVAGLNCNWFLGVDQAANTLAGFYEESGGAGHQIVGGTAVDDGEYHFAVFTYDGSNMKLYLDGVADASAVADAIGPDSASQQLACIAGALTSAGANAGSFDGVISHVAIWSIDLTADDILNLYNAGDPQGPTASVTWPTSGTSTNPIQEIVITLTDGAAAVDSSTVTTGNVVLKKDGVTLTNGVDYTFSYNHAAREITLYRIGYTFLDGSFSIILNNIAGTDATPITTDTTLTVTITEATSQEISTFYDGLSIGNVDSDAEWQEISGLTHVQRPANFGHIWAHSDGSIDKILALSVNNASNQGEWTLVGIDGSDYEDISSATVDGIPYIYLADIGDNANARANFVIQRLIEPNITGGNGNIDATGITSITGTFDSGNAPTHKDTETLLVDSTGGMYLITKRETTPSVYYCGHQISSTGTVIFQRLGDCYPIPTSAQAANTNNGNVVGGNISYDGTHIYLKTYTGMWDFPITGSIYESICPTASPRFVWAYRGGGRYQSHPNAEPQGEAVTTDESGNLYTMSEFNATHGSAADQYPLFKYLPASGVLVEKRFKDGVYPDASYTGTADTYIWDTTPSTAYGTDQTFVVDNPHPGSDARVGLLRFDISEIPTGSTIIGAEVHLFIDTEGQGWRYHRMLTGWTESSTHSTLTGTSGQVLALNNIEVASGYEVQNGVNLDTVIDIYTKDNVLVSTIQDWIDHPPDNYGWLILGTHATDGQQFSSRQHATVAEHPELVVRYFAPQGAEAEYAEHIKITNPGIETGVFAWYKAFDASNRTVDGASNVSQLNNAIGTSGTHLYASLGAQQPLLTRGDIKGNLVQRSQNFSASEWTKFGSINADAIGDPDGGLDGDEFIEGAGSNSFSLSQNLDGGALEDNKTYTFSIRAKANTRDHIALRIKDRGDTVRTVWFNLNAGTVGTQTLATGSISSLSNGWYLCSMTFDCSAGSSTPYARIHICQTNGSLVYTGNGSSSIYIYGAHFYKNSWNSTYAQTNDFPHFPGAANTKNAIWFNGSSHVMSGAFTLPNPSTIYISYYTMNTNSGSVEKIFAGGEPNSGYLVKPGTGAENLRLFAGVTGGDVIFQTGQYGVITAIFDGSNSVLHTDLGGQVTSGNIGTNNLNGFTIGGGNNALNLSNIFFVEAVIKSGHDSWNNRTGWYKYLTGNLR